jgi:hypothetical protein
VRRGKVNPGAAAARVALVPAVLGGVPAAGAAAQAEARRVAPRPPGPRMRAHPVRQRRPRILEMHRERRMHRLAIRAAAADGGVDAAAAVRPAARPYNKSCINREIFLPWLNP